MRAFPLQQTRGWLIDLDGTIYVSDRLLPRAAEFLERLDAERLPWLCLTNNSSTSGDAYVAKLGRLGIEIGPQRVMTSGQATIHHLLTATPHRRAFVVGTTALQDEFERSGIALDAEAPDCVVLGYDTTVDYPKLCRATRHLFDGKPYFATHPDRTCISDDGLLPDIALTIEGLAAVTGRRPLIIGKPERPILSAAAARLGVPLDQLAMIGDQLDTDMTMAQRFGLKSVLVLSGESDRVNLAASNITPDLVVEDVGALLELFG